MHKFETEVVSRREGACVATIVSFDLIDFHALEDSLKWEIVQNAVQRWKDHVLPRETKEAGFVNDGKSFTLRQIAEDLARSPGRSSGPSEKDRETGATLAASIRKAHPIPEIGMKWGEQMLTEETWDILGPDIRAEIDNTRCVALQAKVAAQKAVKPWVSWEWNYTLDLEENCIRASHAVRQPEPKKKVSAPKWV